MASIIKVDTIQDVNSNTIISSDGSGNLTPNTFTALTISGDLTVDTDTLKVDSSNNRVGVGTTSPSVTFDAEADGATVANFNRATSDGSVIELQKDGTTVGEIGTTNGTDFYIGSSSTVDTGLRFQTDEIVPVGNAGGNRSDAIDLGKSNIRWKDFWLSGNIYLGGTTSANALDDYETGSFTPEFSSTSGTFTTLTYERQNGRYVKVGKLLFFSINLFTSNVVLGTASGSLEVINLPFTTANISQFQQSATIGRMYRFATDFPNIKAGIASNNTKIVFSNDATNATTPTNLAPSALTTGSNSFYNGIDITGCYRID